ncbi:MAG: hypothetical protein VX536_06080 [Pseudomonadota bacterium]|jgi:hypothetical protein|nr:hypothetical protein [Pseudomonadota bacterium]MEC7550543.1 hypothetical protein [Pseudomonadota bacterium]MEC7581659.1 hypothetical protein [Pseudomonadota bacterium]
MRFSYAKHLTGSASLSALFLLCSSLSLGAEGAAGADEDTQAVFWNFVIAVIVLATLIASAALPVAALRQWPGRWRFFAMFPLAALIFQLAVIVTGRLDDPGSHRLWPFELFAWAMANMIYMVIIMTAKRKLDKHDAEETS